jgi:hypothetical protein
MDPSTIVEEIDAVLGIPDTKINRLRSPFIVDGPQSVKADIIGLSDGELITKYAEDAVAMMQTRDSLQKEVNALRKQMPGSTIAITHFKNWAENRESLLLHVKPTEVEQVVAVVKGVKTFNEKGGVKVKYGYVLYVMGQVSNASLLQEVNEAAYTQYLPPMTQL